MYTREREREREGGEESRRMRKGERKRQEEKRIFREKGFRGNVGRTAKELDFVKRRPRLCVFENDHRRDGRMENGEM